MTQAKSNIIDVNGFSLSFRLQKRDLSVLDGVNLTISEGEAVGLVGESGSGKSTLARALLGLLPEGISHIRGGRIVIDGKDVTQLTPRQWERVRGRPVAIIFQDPLSYLNPVMKIGKQIAESVMRHSPDEPVRERVLELLRLVKLPEQCVDSYPHELSGGMRQRALLAIALGCRPSVLVADEPTTALDVTTQAEILELLRELREEIGMALLLISHDLGIVSTTCDRIYVMYAGQLVEWGRTEAVFHAPQHPYAHGLLQAAAATRDENGMFSTIPGDPPSLSAVRRGCPFEPRCVHAVAKCAEQMPPPSPAADGAPGHMVRCWLFDEAQASGSGKDAAND